MIDIKETQNKLRQVRNRNTRFKIGHSDEYKRSCLSKVCAKEGINPVYEGEL